MLSKLTIALATIGLLGAPGAFGAFYQCAIEGTVHWEACCCASDEDAPATAELSAQSPACCTVSPAPREGRAVPAAEAMPTVVPAVATFVAILAALAPSNARAVVPAHEGLAGPAPPDLYLQNCAFLI